jgi:nicotinate-nucleotide adenylyltransferase
MLQVPWYGLKKIARECAFLVAPRNRTAMLNRPGLRITRLAMPLIELSSSLIRARVRRGASIRFLVPKTVARYIQRHRLYQRSVG